MDSVSCSPSQPAGFASEAPPPYSSGPPPGVPYSGGYGAPPQPTAAYPYPGHPQAAGIPGGQVWQC